MSGRPRERVTAARLYLSQILGKPVLDASGAQIARIQDLVARVGAAPHPPVTGLVARHGRRDFYLDAQQVADLSPHGACMRTFRIDLRPFERRDGEVLLRRDVLDKQLVDVDGHRVIRANDLQLVSGPEGILLAGVDVSAQGLLRRLGPAPLTRRIEGRGVIDWADVESFAVDVPEVRLRVSHAGVARLHPVEIARILQALPARQGREILGVLDDETAADAVRELDSDDAASLIEGLDRERAADILDEMDPDDAADVLGDLPGARAGEILRLMEPDEAADVRALLRYHPDTAGGLMTTDYVALPRDLTAAEALARLRALDEPPDPLYHVYLVPREGSARLAGVAPLRDIALAAPETPLDALTMEGYRTARPDQPTREVARVMAEYNLAALPVVTGGGDIVGVVIVDDAMDVLLPDLWRQRLSALLG